MPTPPATPAHAPTHPPVPATPSFEVCERLAASGLSKAVAARERKRGRELHATFAVQGYWPLTPTEALAESDLAVLTCYRLLVEDAAQRGVRLTGRSQEPNPSWMLDSDFAFVNIRACSPDPARPGRVTDALKVLPTMRVNGIHLAPFFDCCMDNLYAVDSLRMVCDAVLDPTWSAGGLLPDDQIRLLVLGIHALGWSVGFDLEPHTSNFSRLVLEHPECFRWLELNAERSALAGGVTQEAMLEREAQAEIVLRVRSLIQEALDQHGLSSIEDQAQGATAVRTCHQAIIQRLIGAGLWTLPSHTWGGVGLPAFSHYDHVGNYPEYTYLTAQGENHRQHAFGMLSPFGLYRGLPLNRAPEASHGEVAERCDEAVALFRQLFPSVRERYGFDFVRLDYVDHVFDSVQESHPDRPTSDRLTPAVLAEVLGSARAGAPGVGAMAERMGTDVEAYGSIGFNLLLGTDMLGSMSHGYLSFLFDLQRRLEACELPCSVLAAIDSHDSGHPLFWTQPLSTVVGADGLALRHFIARFGTFGPHRRPKYEVMGNQDLSYGLYDANNHTQSLTWVKDKAFNRRYHALEDLYERLRERMRMSRLGPAHADAEGWAAWFIDSDDPGARLLCVIGCEPPAGQVRDWVQAPPELVPVGPVHIDVTLGSAITHPVVLEIPLSGEAPHLRQLQGPMLSLRSLQPRECRLFSVRQAG